MAASLTDDTEFYEHGRLAPPLRTLLEIRPAQRLPVLRLAGLEDIELDDTVCSFAGRVRRRLLVRFGDRLVIDGDGQIVPSGFGRFTAWWLSRFPNGSRERPETARRARSQRPRLLLNVRPRTRRRPPEKG